LPKIVFIALACSPHCLVGALAAEWMFDPYGAVLSSPRSRLTCQRGDQVMGWCKPAQSGSSIGAMGGTRKGSSGPASHLNAPGRSTAGAYPRAGTRKRSSTLDLIDREHRSSTKSADDRGGPNRWTLYLKKRFQPGRPASARRASRKDQEGGQHTHPPCSARLTTTFDRRQLNAANGRKKIDLSCFYVTLGSQDDRPTRLFCSSLFSAAGPSHIRASLIYFGYQR